MVKRIGLCITQAAFCDAAETLIKAGEIFSFDKIMAMKSVNRQKSLWS